LITTVPTSQSVRSPRLRVVVAVEGAVVVVVGGAVVVVVVVVVVTGAAVEVTGSLTGAQATNTIVMATRSLSRMGAP
jgi:hypothetical protein